MKHLQIIKFSLSIALMALLSACGGGGGGSSDGGESSDSESNNIVQMQMTYSVSPVLNNEATISFDAVGSLDDISWTILLEPEGSDLVLQIADDLKSVRFTPLVAGKYSIKASSLKGGSEKIANFTVYPIFPFNEAKIQGVDLSKDIESQSGIVLNQSWVSSTHLSEQKISDIVAKYKQLSIKGFDSVNGLLIEYDESDESVLEAIESLKLEKGIYQVINRYYGAENLYSINNNVLPLEPLELFKPDGDKFNDEGSNWHLEKINIYDAWQYTRGHKDITVGVIDGGYDFSHEDFDDRVSSLVTDDDYKSIKERISRGNGTSNSIFESDETSEAFDGMINHGNASMGTIVGASNNGIGITGINWNSKAIGVHMWDDKAYQDLLSKSVHVTSASVSPTFPDNYRHLDAGDREERYVSVWTSQQEKVNLARDNLNVLFIHAAGNGPTNSVINSEGIYGIDAKYENGIMHYDVNQNYEEKPNIMVVGALLSNGRLAFYSAYGESVDIAAPTAYKALKKPEFLNNYSDGAFWEDYGVDRGYDGTSASAPVVSGVASLIYSLYPNFTGAEVKDILISSATEYVTERELGDGDIGPRILPKVLDRHQGIPILNAKEALKMAKDIVNKKAIVSDWLSNTNQASITVRSSVVSYLTESISWRLFHVSDNGVKSELSSGISDSESFNIPIEQIGTLFQLELDIDFKDVNSQNTYSAQIEHDLTYVNINVRVFEEDESGTSYQPVGNVDVELYSALASSVSGKTDATGNAVFKVKPGVYRTYAELDGYHAYRDDGIRFELNSTIHQKVIYLNSKQNTVPVGSLTGTVTDDTGIPVAGAQVTIVSDTNSDITRSTISDSEGRYLLVKIPKEDDEGNTLYIYTLNTVKLGYETKINTFVSVVPNAQKTVDVVLVSTSDGVIIDVPPAQVTSINPLSANVNTLTSFSITGQNFPESMTAQIQGADCPAQYKQRVSATLFTLQCQHNVAGTLAMTVVEQSGGALLAGGEAQVQFNAPIQINLPLVNGFDYPLGHRGYDTNGRITALLEQIADEKNTYSNLSGVSVSDNHSRGATNFDSTLWRNASDVGNFLPGTYTGGLHPGEDWNLGGGNDDAGQAVYATAAGQVMFIRPTYQSGYELGAWTIVLKHKLNNDEYVYSLYSHITAENQTQGNLVTSADQFFLQAGDLVEKGQLIARVVHGNQIIAGFTAHLHFEMRTTEPTTVDLWPSDNGNGYYSHDNSKLLSSISALEVASTIAKMRDLGIIDPSDYIDANRIAPRLLTNTLVTNIQYPTLIAGETATFTIIGESLPDSIAMSLHGAECGVPYDVTDTQAKIDCTVPADATGELAFYIKSYSGGTILLGAENQTVVIGTPAEPPVTPTPTGKLNDSGITWGGNYPNGNNAGCTGETIGEQDCSHGRDALAAAGQLTKVGGGMAGFDFTKLDSNGHALADQTQDYTTQPWACVKDNHTGLIWEVKTPDAMGTHLHSMNDRFNWYNTNSATNGGAVGVADDDGAICTGYNSADSSTYCNTQAFVARVNASNAGAGLCGATDWRLPDITELQSVVHFGRLNPSIESNYFPNTGSSFYWSSSPFVGNSNYVWGVDFIDGSIDSSYRAGSNYYFTSQYYPVRLVRTSK